MSTTKRWLNKARSHSKFLGRLWNFLFWNYSLSLTPHTHAPTCTHTHTQVLTCTHTHTHMHAPLRKSSLTGNLSRDELKEIKFFFIRSLVVKVKKIAIFNSSETSCFSFVGNLVFWIFMGCEKNDPKVAQNFIGRVRKNSEINLLQIWSAFNYSQFWLRFAEFFRCNG